MALRVDTMNPANLSSSNRKSLHLGRKLLLLLLLTIACTQALTLLFRREFDLPLIVFSFFADSILSLVTGLGTRLLLSKRNWLIRTLIAIVLPVVGLITLGLFSEWELGVDFLLLLEGYVSYQDLTHLVLGIIISLMALWAWHRRSGSDGGREVQPVRQEVEVRSRQDRQPQNQALGQRLNLNVGNAVRRMNTSRLMNRPRLLTNQPVRQERPRRSSAHRPNIQLALVEEHRCPYCLEPVTNNDPRGVKKCEVCHTLHHADCWEVTGMCQVPHINNKS